MRGASKGSQFPSRWSGLGDVERANAQGRLSEAEPLYERALEMREKGRRLIEHRPQPQQGPLPPLLPCQLSVLAERGDDHRLRVSLQRSADTDHLLLIASFRKCGMLTYCESFLPAVGPGKRS